MCVENFIKVALMKSNFNIHMNIHVLIMFVNVKMVNIYRVFPQPLKAFEYDHNKNGESYHFDIYQRKKKTTFH